MLVEQPHFYNLLTQLRITGPSVDQNCPLCGLSGLSRAPLPL